MMRIPFGKVPSTSALFSDYTADFSRVRQFYPQSYSLEAITAFARQRQALDSTHRDRLCTALLEQQKKWGASATAVASIEKLGHGAVAVMTGQQPGLFTGPLYTILKALTAIKLAKAIEDAGVPAVPVFWVASEDHDFEEIRWAAVLDRDSALRKVHVDLSNDERSPVGWLKFHDDVTAAAGTCLSMFPASEFLSEVREILDLTYRPGRSPSDAFAGMMARLFADTELVLADPLDAELKRIAAPTLTMAVRQNSEIRKAVLAQSQALSSAGYHEQVKVDENFTGLFAYRNRSRSALKPNEISTDLALSPNALLRPVVQDSIFPTVAYIGGPAETDYFAQAAAVYQVLGRPVPPVYPRISVTVLEPRVSRAMKKYGIEFPDVYKGRDVLKRKAIESCEETRFDEVRDHLIQQIELLRPSLVSADPTLAGALDTSRRKVIHQIESLRAKFVNAEVRRHETLERRLDAIANSLFPEKKLQERVINVTSFLVRYGLGFVGRLQRAVDLDSRQHQIIEI
jgi:bacillithiol synthase